MPEYMHQPAVVHVNSTSFKHQRVNDTKRFGGSSQFGTRLRAPNYDDLPNCLVPTTIWGSTYVSKIMFSGIPQWLYVSISQFTLNKNTTLHMYMLYVITYNTISSSCSVGWTYWICKMFIRYIMSNVSLRLSPRQPLYLTQIMGLCIICYPIFI